MALQALLGQAKQQLATTLNLPANEAAIEAQILLRHALGDVSRAWLISHEEQALTPEQQALLEELLQRRLQGEPIAYILGKREFYGLDFSITPGVLIPRPDTETLVEAALLHIPPDRPCRILDLGTGSGAIAIAIAYHRPQATVTAVDRSEAAIKVARGNALRLLAPSPLSSSVEGEGVHVGNLRLLQSDWFSALQDEVFDVIVSNPPYVAATDPHLQQGDLRFEPTNALASGLDGLDDIRIIIAQAPPHLMQGGWLLFEHGYDQAALVAEMLKNAGFENVGHVADIAGILRVTRGRML